MSTRITILLIGGLMSVLFTAPGQPATNTTFTKITTGSIVTNSAASFGCAWADYDNDGRLDLFVANAAGQNNFLYHNIGDGTFARFTTGSIVNDGGDSLACAWADYDNDGYLDLFVANNGNNFLYHNTGKRTFTKVFTGQVVTDVGNSRGGAWADYDNDGFLDLFVPNQNDQSRFLYRNDGKGTLTRIFGGRIATDRGYSNFSAWGDYDGDGLPDLFVPNDFQLKQLYQNNGDGTFAKIPADDSRLKDGGAAYGAVWVDFDNDGDPDLFTTNFQGKNHLFRNDGDGTFTKLTGNSAFDLGGLASNAAWGDYDNDGWLDLLVTRNGFPGPNLLFRNNGDGTFTRTDAGSVTSDLADSNGCAWGDYDNDGFLDLFVANGGLLGSQNSFLYRNNGNSNGWLKIRCVGTVSNRSAIGAKIQASALINGAARWQTRVISSGGGMGGGNLEAHFGLGDATNVLSVRVEWSSGIVQELQDVAVRQSLTVTEAAPTNITIVTQPRSQSVTVGQRAKLFVKASGPPTLRFQWRTNGVDIARATNRTLVFTSVQLAHARSYSVAVSNMASGVYVESEAAVLSVAAAPLPAPHRLQAIRALPDRTMEISLSGRPPGIVKGYFDIYPVEASTTLTNWTTLATLVRTNELVDALSYLDVEATNSSAKFYRTFSNHLATPLPKPTGPYPVATLSRSLNRMATFWYPTQSKTSAVPVKYLEDSFVTQHLIFRDYIEQVQSFRAFSISNSFIATNQATYPVLIYSHAWGGHRRENIDKTEDLASHGYIVVAVDHSDSGSPASALATRRQDILGLLNQLATLNSSDPLFRGRLNVAQTGIFGWSFGGATAGETCRVDSRCKAGVNMDGTFFNPALVQSGLNQPFMIISSSFSDFDDPNDDVRGVFNRLTQNAYRLKIAGIGHHHFGEPELVITADDFSRRSAEVMRAYLLSFFDKHLRGQDNHLLDGFAPQYPEVVEFLRK